MLKKITLIGFLLLLQKNYGQNSSGFTLKVIEAQSKKALPSVVVSVQNTSFLRLTSVSGTVLFTDLPPSNYFILIHSQGYIDQLLAVTITDNVLTDLGTILLASDPVSEQQSATIALNEDQLNEDFNSSESTAPLLQASRDVFQQAAAFQWGQTRFRIRGLDAENATLLLNGIALNKLYDGRPQWGDWGGINDVLRNQEIAIGTAAFDYSFGGILGAQQINTRASGYRPGIRLSFAGTNTTYNWRMMATYASGVSK
ncbi:MAG: TonB-dependent receptor, partial [Flavobacterium sp.]